MGQKLIDISGQRFGRLVAIEHLSKRNGWRCRCDCGREAVVCGNKMRKGLAKSCGCLCAELRALGRPKHGGVGTKEYKSWAGAKKRCLNPLDPHWKDYGGRGITMSPLWRYDFAAFLREIGPCPSPDHSLDRIDMNGHYEPGNVRWSDKFAQANNRRNNHVVTWRGSTRTIADWMRETGLSCAVISGRIRRGWSLDEVFTNQPNTLRHGVPSTPERNAKISRGLREFWQRSRTFTQTQ